MRRRMMTPQEYLAALKRWFHQGPEPGQYYRPSGEYHSLGGRGGKADMNGNRLDRHGKIIGRTEAFYGTIGSSAPSWLKSCGAWERLHGGGRR
jgi:hypothetical protein